MSDCDCIVIEPDCPSFHRKYSPYCRLIDVSANTPQVYLRVASSIRFSSQVLTFNHDRVYMELRRKGCENLLATSPAWRRDADGNIGFYFDGNLFDQSPGFFIGDVYINCNYCFSVQLRLSGCEAAVIGCYVEPALEECGQGECGLTPSIGTGAIGGLACPAPASECGTVAPFFPMSNTIPVSPSACATPSCSIVSVSGIGPIG
jgi:hypothetical protein